VTDKQLLSTALDFRRGVIENKKSTNWCYAISAPLEGYLNFIGVYCELTIGYIGDTEHFWITLPNGRILDPTADQFSDDMPKVYLGRIPNNYKQKL